MQSLRRHSRLGAVFAMCACLGLLTACANPFRPEPTPETSLLPTRTPAPAPTQGPEPTKLPSTPSATDERAVESTTTASAAITRYAACSDARPKITPITRPVPDSTGRIAYLTTGGDVALTDLSGRLRVDITSDAFVSEDGQAGRLYQFPTFSGDGQNIAFTSLSTTPDFNGITHTVHFAPAAGGTTIRDLYATSDWNIPYLDWSPSGHAVAFLTIGQTDGAIRVVNTAGDDAAIFDTGVPTYWHWRSDSSAMITHLGGRATAPGAANISVIEAAGAAKTGQRVLDALPGNFQSPHTSPDARHMLFVANTGQSDELVLADDAGRPTCTLALIRNNAFFAFSPDGSKVAVMDTSQPVSEPAPLTIYDLALGTERIVHEQASAFFWSPTGTALAVYSVVLDSAATPLGIASGRRNALPAQSRSAALRLEVVDAANGAALRVADTIPSRQFLQYLQFFDQYSRAVSPWSPDGKHLVFSSLTPERGAADIAVASLNDTASAMDVRRVAAGTVAFWSPK